MRWLPVALWLAACAHPSPDSLRLGAPPPPWQGTASLPAAIPEAAPPAGAHPAVARLGDGARSRLLAAARRHLGRFYPGDCSRFVRQVHAEAGVPMALLAAAPGRSASETLWRSLRRVERPRPGDLAFFHGTFDRDGDGRQSDRFTHVALVEALEGPRVMLIHRSSRGIERLPMNLARRHEPAENGYLRKRRAGDRPGLRVLSGELFAGYATAVPAESAPR